MRERGRETETDLRERGQETARRAAERARETAEETRERAAGGMETAAQRVREQTEGKGGMQGTAGTRLAEGMERTAGYLREHDTRAMMSDLENYIREHPAQSLLVAVALGFVIGRTLR